LGFQQAFGQLRQDLNRGRFPLYFRLLAPSGIEKQAQAFRAVAQRCLLSAWLEIVMQVVELQSGFFLKLWNPIEARSCSAAFASAVRSIN
jgi:hypothetical protein